MTEYKKDRYDAFVEFTASCVERKRREIYDWFQFVKTIATEQKETGRFSPVALYGDDYAACLGLTKDGPLNYLGCAAFSIKDIECWSRAEGLDVEIYCEHTAFRAYWYVKFSNKDEQ